MMSEVFCLLIRFDNKHYHYQNKIQTITEFIDIRWKFFSKGLDFIYAFMGYYQENKGGISWISIIYQSIRTNY